MAKSDRASTPTGQERSLFLLLRESGDALEATSPPFDVAAGATQLRKAACAHGLLRPEDIPTRIWRSRLPTWKRKPLPSTSTLVLYGLRRQPMPAASCLPVLSRLPERQLSNDWTFVSPITSPLTRSSSTPKC